MSPSHLRQFWKISSSRQKPASFRRRSRWSVPEAVPIVLQKWGMNMVEATVVEWKKAVGDRVTQGESSGAMTRLGAISADTVGSEGIFMGVSRLPPGMRSSAHLHTNCESSLYVSSGRGRFLTGPRLERATVIEPGDFENRADIFLKADDGELAAILVNILHPVDQYGETGAIDKCHVC